MVHGVLRARVQQPIVPHRRHHRAILLLPAPGVHCQGTNVSPFAALTYLYSHLRASQLVVDSVVRDDLGAVGRPPWRRGRGPCPTERLVLAAAGRYPLVDTTVHNRNAHPLLTPHPHTSLHRGLRRAVLPACRHRGAPPARSVAGVPHLRRRRGPTLGRQLDVADRGAVGVAVEWSCFPR